jgi:hypothetical protein
MRRKRRKRATIGFSNQRFLELLTELTGITPVGELGRETPLDFSSLERARGSLLMKEVFSKYDDGSPSPEKETLTWKRFHEAEHLCLAANERIAKWRWYDEPFWVRVRARIRETLGQFDWDECSKFFAFGPGATTRLPRSRSFMAYKYSGTPESTAGNAALAEAAIAVLPLWKQSVVYRPEGPGNLVKIVPGNSIITVPKNYKTDRTIAKEPDMNIYIQKGIGRVIRYRLKSVGINLDDQTPNQLGALEGSITGQLATMDLSMASDTVACRLVEWLLPPDWGHALELARSPIGVLPSGEFVHYQKFSSMGNGYTFELETLIFWAIAQECCCPDNIWRKDTSVRVYGDDIVIPTPFYGLLESKLTEVGFKPNPGKSFFEGPYRESCGKHYFQGMDVTPFYVRKKVETLDRLFLAHNNVFRWGQRTGIEVCEALTSLRSLSPSYWREPRLPDGFGDGAFIGNVDELRLDAHPHGWEYWQVKVLSRLTTEINQDLPFGQLIASLKASSASVTVLKEGSLERGDPLPIFVGSAVTESLSGLPGREGKDIEMRISIPRYPQK